MGQIEVECDECDAVIIVEDEDELPQDCPSPFCEDGVMHNE